MTGEQILRKLDEGFTLHGCMFGFFLINPIDAKCTNVHNGAARSLLRKKIVVSNGESYVKHQVKYGDKVKAIRRLGHDLAEKDEILVIRDDRGNGWYSVQSTKTQSSFLVKRKEFIPL